VPARPLMPTPMIAMNNFRVFLCIILTEICFCNKSKNGQALETNLSASASFFLGHHSFSLQYIVKTKSTCYITRQASINTHASVWYPI